MLASLTAAFVVSLGPMRRVSRLTVLARRIGGGELEVRMPVSPRRDELDVIAETTNRMIDEVVQLLEQVKGATDAVAHDLRAPLAQVRQRLEVLEADFLAGSQGEPARSTLADAIAGIDGVLKRFNALLRVAELEASVRRARFELVDPMSLAAGVCELYEPMAEAREQRLALTGEWGHQLHADPQLLFEALANLVDNAIKFSPPRGAIAVHVGLQDGRVVLAVGDRGPGIPINERAAVIQRFARGPHAGHVPGSGLGLSLVAAITRLHGFALDLADNAPGLKISIVAERTRETLLI